MSRLFLFILIVLCLPWLYAGKTDNDSTVFSGQRLLAFFMVFLPLTELAVCVLSYCYAVSSCFYCLNRYAVMGINVVIKKQNCLTYLFLRN